jgi:hypothetical protein
LDIGESHHEHADFPAHLHIYWILVQKELVAFMSFGCEPPRRCANRFSISKCDNDREEGSAFCAECGAKEDAELAAKKAKMESIAAQIKALNRPTRYPSLRGSFEVWVRARPDWPNQFVPNDFVKVSEGAPRAEEYRNTLLEQLWQAFHEGWNTHAWQAPVDAQFPRTESGPKAPVAHPHKHEGSPTFDRGETCLVCGRDMNDPVHSSAAQIVSKL